MHEQNIVCSQTRLDGTMHEQTIICAQLFAGHIVSSWPMKRKKKMDQKIIFLFVQNSSLGNFCFRCGLQQSCHYFGGRWLNINFNQFLISHQLEPENTEDYIDYLKSVGWLDEAATRLAFIVNKVFEVFCIFNAQLQRSKLTFSKSRLLATFNCKMVAIKKFSRQEKT